MRAVWVAVVVAACGGDAAGVDGNVTGDGRAVDTPANATPHQFCISETNRYRAIVGVPALVESMALVTYADTGAMVDFSSSPHNHFTTTNGGGIAFAENECPVQLGWQLPAGGDLKALVGQCVAAFYSEGPGTGTAHGHYNNMMGNYGHLGCGIYQSGTGVTIVQDYGN